MSPKTRNEGFIRFQDIAMPGHEPSPEEESIASASPFRTKLRKLFHSNKFHLVIILLVLFDCIIVVAELVVDLNILKHRCDPDKGDRKAENYNLTSAALHVVSLVVLTLFMMEICLKIYAFRNDFFKSKLELADAFIVTISWIMDIVLLHHHDALNVVSLIIFLRLWRVVRIIHGIAMSMVKPIENKLEHQTAQNKKLEAELEKAKLYASDLENEIAELHKNAAGQDLSSRHFTNGGDVTQGHVQENNFNS